MPPIKILLKIYQGVLLSCSMLAGSAILLVFGIVPAARVSWNTFKDIQKTAEEVAFLNKKVNTLKDLDEATLQRQLTTLLAAIPVDASVPILLSSLDSVAGRSGLSIADVNMDAAISASDAASLKKAETIGGSIPLPLTVKGLGSITSLRDFFVASLSMKRLVRIRNFDIAFPTATAIATARIGIDEFAAPVLKRITSPNQPLDTLSATEEGIISKLNSFTSGENTLPTTPAVFGKVDPFSR